MGVEQPPVSVDAPVTGVQHEESAQEFATAVLSFLAATRRTRGRVQPLLGDISVPQLVLLDAVEAAGSEGISAMASRLGLSQPTVTRGVIALERDGLVGRTADLVDGRVRVVRLTPRGKAVVQAKQTLVLSHLTTLWSRLNAAEQEVAAPLLRRLTDLVEHLL